MKRGLSPPTPFFYHKGVDIMKKSCEECKHFWCESYGDNYNEPRETEYGCKIEENIEKYLYEKETNCHHYDAGKCEVCGAFIGKGYVFWASGPYCDFKCCSEKCQKEKKMIILI